MRVGIIGSGRMGLALARILESGGHQASFYDANVEALARAESRGFQVHRSLEELAGNSDYLLVAVSPRATIGVLEELRALAHKGVLAGKMVSDIATFKEELMGIYKDFPEEVRVSSIHPLFGPGIRDPRRHRVAVVPVPGRERDATETARFLEELGFKVLIVDHKTHDAVVALTIGISYTIGLSIANLVSDMSDEGFDIKLVIDGLSGTTFRHLMVHMKSILLDTQDMMEYILGNSRVKRLASRLARVIDEVSVEPRRASSRAYTLRETIGQKALIKAYESLYRCLESENEAWDDT